MSREYKDGERSPNGVTHGPKLHRITCDLCDAFVEREHFQQRPSSNGRTDVGYYIPEGLYFRGTASDPAPFALKGWAHFSVTTQKNSSDRSEIEGYDVDVGEERLDICPRHVGDVLGMIVRARPK